MTFIIDMKIGWTAKISQMPTRKLARMDLRSWCETLKSAKKKSKMLRLRLKNRRSL
jgi:hypothetical protein